MFEKDLPGQNTAGFNDKAEIGELPLETVRDHQQLVGLQRQRSQLQEHQVT